MIDTLSVTLVIIIITSIVSLLAFNNRELLYKMMFSPYNVKHMNEWYRVITHAFVHKDYWHLLLNMFVLYQFGYQVGHGYFFGTEAMFEYDYGIAGHYYFVLLYIGGFLCATLPAMRKHSDNPNYLSLGASGAVSAVVFSCIILFPTARMTLVFLPFFDLPAVIFGSLYIGYEIYMDKRGGTGIAHDAHLWGALFGVVFTVIINFDYLKNFVEQVKSIF